MENDNGLPRIGNTARRLGVRVPEDIQPDDADMVHCGEKGMSVAPSVAALPRHRVPRRLRHLAEGAAGKSSDCVWSLGSGRFGKADVSETLSLFVDSHTHGVVRPAFSMMLEDYAIALSNTRAFWRVDEV